MLARWNGRAESATVAQWSAKYDAQDDGTTSATLQTILRVEARLTPIAGTVAYPYIQLVDYASLPVANRSDKTGRTFLHWIVRLSDTTYHDPYWWTDRGANLSATKAQLDAARRYSGGPPVSITERPTEMASNGEPRVQYGRVVNVLPADATLERSIEVLRGVFAAKQTIGYSYDDAGIGNLADRTAVLWDIPPGNRAAFSEFFATYYPGVKVAFKSDATPLPPDPIPPTPATLPAGAVLGVHELGYTGADAQSARDGCPFIMVMDDATGVQNLQRQYPHFKFMHRYYFNAYVSAEWLVGEKHGIPLSGTDTTAWYRGFNEYDVPGFGGSPEDIRRRAGEDIKCALLLRQRAPKAGWIAGGFPHGNPDFTKDEVCRAMRDGYAEAYNSGLFAAFDMHNYTLLDPNNPFNWNYVAPMWLERNCDFLFQKCGFDPKVRRIIHTETGVEPRGFRGIGYSVEQFAAWATQRYLPAMRAPLVVGQTTYPSPSIGGTLFQRGDYGQWVGYECGDYCGWLASNIWQMQRAVAADVETQAEAMDLTEGGMPPAGYVPPTKVYVTP